MHQAESVPPDEFVELNTFYLNAGNPLPPLVPQAYFTYAKDETISHVLEDIHTHIGADASLEGVAIWIRPPPQPPVPVAAAMDLDPSASSDDEALDYQKAPRQLPSRWTNQTKTLLPILRFQPILRLCNLSLYRPDWCSLQPCRPSWRCS